MTSINYVLPKYNLSLTAIEIGMIYASIKNFDEFPPVLKAKLNKLTTRMYVNHPTLGKRARKEVKEFEKIIREGEKE